MQKMRFEPHLIPTLATIAGLVLFVNLGLWQSGKAERRATEIEQHTARARLGPFAITGQPVDPGHLQDAPVTVQGVYESQYQFFVDNRQEDGQPGVHVVTPLKISGSETRVLVNRGWVGWGQSRSALPLVSTPDTLVVVTGVVFVPVNKPFLLMPNPPEQLPRLWSRLDLERFTKEVAFAVQPVVVLQTGAGHGDGLIRKWPPPEDRIARHQSYAYQWFGMAFALLIFYGFASVRPGKRE
jgi:surfeit locus 1 family protein